ncbi:MAG: hypothetical protein WC326_00665 [Candidatus Delongbacteria bacterium]
MIRRTLFDLKQRLGNRSALELHGQLAAEERLSRDELERLAWKRRRAIVFHAYDQVPFYQRKYQRAGFHPNDLQDPADFAQVPVLSKDELRVSFEELIAHDSRPGQRRLSTTGGSTGVPVRVLFDRRVALEAFAWRVLDWWGLHASDHVGFVYRRTRRGAAQAVNQALWWPTRRLFLDAAAMTPARVGYFLHQLERLRPPLLQGYMGALADLAGELETRGVRPDFLRAVWSTSTPLPASLRHKMERAFGCPVYDQYGCGEVFWLACECREQAGLHVFASRRTIEAVDGQDRPQPAGEWGDLLITDHENRVFPIIRYRNGDRGRLLAGACPCGRSLPLMDSVKGRISDALRLPGGLTLSGEFLTTIFDDHPEAVQAFQVHQAADGSLTLRCVPGDDARALRQIELATAALQARIGDSTHLRLELVEHIGHDRGKTRFIISELSHRHGD